MGWGGEGSHMKRKGILAGNFEFVLVKDTNMGMAQAFYNPYKLPKTLKSNLNEHDSLLRETKGSKLKLLSETRLSLFVSLDPPLGPLQFETNTHHIFFFDQTNRIECLEFLFH